LGVAAKAGVTGVTGVAERAKPKIMAIAINLRRFFTMSLSL